MCEGNQTTYERICKGEFACIRGKLDRLDRAIRGNGGAGIQVRLDRLEQCAHSRSRLLWIIVGCVVVMAGRAIANMIGI